MQTWQLGKRAKSLDCKSVYRGFNVYDNTLIIYAGGTYFELLRKGEAD